MGNRAVLRAAKGTELHDSAPELCTNMEQAYADSEATTHGNILLSSSVC